MIQFDNVSKIYSTKQGDVHALDHFSLGVNPGEFLVIRGSSGCGKTTLLLTVGGMMRPTEGTITADGQDLYAISPKERCAFRSERIGFVFQMFHLIPYLTAMENVLVVQSNTDAKRKAIDLFERLGLSHRLHHYPSELSAGERQRTAIARAFMNDPKMILADEPTGNLDPDNARDVIQHLSDYHKGGGTVLFVTHGHAADAFADRIIHIEDGQLKND